MFKKKLLVQNTRDSLSLIYLIAVFIKEPIWFSAKRAVCQSNKRPGEKIYHLI